MQHFVATGIIFTVKKRVIKKICKIQNETSARRGKEEGRNSEKRGRQFYKVYKRDAKLPL